MCNAMQICSGDECVLFYTTIAGVDLARERTKGSNVGVPEKLTKHLAESLPYELLMLRHTHRQLSQEQNQLDWNVFLESFAIHARNIIDFLTNRSDSRDIEASHFGGAYKPPAHRELDGLKQKLHYQILHLGKRRQGELDREERFNTDDADKLCRWIEDAMARFLSSLSVEYRAHWNEERSQLPKTGMRRVQFGGMNRGTTTADPENYQVGPFYPPGETP
jgi:hypothetical protein